MRCTRLRHGLAVLAGASAFVVANSAAATTLPDDTEEATPTSSASSAAADPAAEAAIAVFDQRMADAGFQNVGPGIDTSSDGSSEPLDPELLAQCEPEVAATMEEVGNLDELLAFDAESSVLSDRYAPAVETASSTATTADPLTAMMEGSEEVSAVVQRLDADEAAAADQLIELMGTEGFAECMEIMAGQSLTADMGVSDDVEMPDLTMPDITMPDLSDLSIPDLSDLSIPDLSDLSIPDLSMPDLSDLSIPEMSDLSIPDLSMPDLSMPEMEFEVAVTSNGDVGVGDASSQMTLDMSFGATMPLSINADLVYVRTGDYLVTVVLSRFNTTEPPMDVDLVAEAQAIVDAL